VRDTGELLIGRGLLVPAASNALNSQIDDYTATEDVAAGYAEGQFTAGTLTVLAGLRLEKTQTQFKTFSLVNGATIVPIAPQRAYTDITPAIHFRYDPTKKILLRAAYTGSIARPTFNQLNPRATISTTNDTVSRGNIDLKRVLSRNFDLSAEYYLGSVGYVTLGVFHKDYCSPSAQSDQRPHPATGVGLRPQISSRNRFNRRSEEIAEAARSDALISSVPPSASFACSCGILR